MKTANVSQSLFMPPPQPAPTLGPASPGAVTGPRILFVDDDAGIRGVLPRVLARAGYRVDAAADGQNGWNALLVGRYDLLITDLNMPGLTGLELVTKVRSLRTSLPVILISGCLDLEPTRLHPWLNLSATLMKPFTAEQLLGTVKEVLQTAGRDRSGNDISFPLLKEPLDDIHPCRGWGINE